MIKIAKQRIERVAREACNIYWSCMYQQGVLCLSVTLEARAEQERKRKSTCGMFPEPPLLDCLVCKVPQANNAKISSNTSWQDFRRFKRFKNIAPMLYLFFYKKKIVVLWSLPYASLPHGELSSFSFSRRFLFCSFGGSLVCISVRACFSRSQ